MQARQCVLKTKATLSSGFLVALCARDSGGMVGFCARRAQRALFQTHSALTDAVFYTDFIGLISAHLQSSVFKLSKDLIDSIHEEGIVAYTS